MTTKVESSRHDNEIIIGPPPVSVNSSSDPVTPQPSQPPPQPVISMKGAVLIGPMKFGLPAGSSSALLMGTELCFICQMSWTAHSHWDCLAPAVGNNTATKFGLHPSTPSLSFYCGGKTCLCCGLSWAHHNGFACHTDSKTEAAWTFLVLLELLLLSASGSCRSQPRSPQEMDSQSRS